MAGSELIVAAWIMVAVYSAIIIFFVVRGALKIKSMNDYAVGSIAFHPAAVGLSLATSMTSAATFIINPGFVAKYGISAAISYGIVMPLASMVSLVVMSKGFRKYGNTIKALSMAQWMSSRYKSGSFGLFFGFLSALHITFIVLICVGLTKILSPALNVSELSVLIGCVVFIFGYMMFGGANSMVYTNTVQGILKFIVAFILLGSGYQHFSNGVHGLIEKLGTIDPKLILPFNTSSFLFRDFFEIYIAQTVIGIAIVCQPHILTKSLLVKTDKDVNKYLITGVIALAIFFSVVFVGLFARLLFPDLMINGKPIPLDGIMPAYVVKEFPVYIGLLVVLGLMSSGIATIESLIQSISTTFTMDIVKPLFFKGGKSGDIKSDKKMMLINKAVIVVTGIIAVYVSYNQLVNPKLSVGILAQNGVYAYFSAAFVPLLFGMFLKKSTIKSVFPASITALIVHFSMYYGKITVPFTIATGENPGVAAAVAIICSIIVGGVLYIIFSRKENV